MALYNNRMWFGTRGHMQWILAPQINYEASKRGFSATATYLNGGAFVRRSSTAAKGYNFTWTLKNRDDVRVINDYADGVFGTGPIYFLEPFAMDKNLLPQFWAVPVLANGDAPLLAGEFEEDRPDLISTPSNTLLYPAKTAVYSLAADSLLASVWIPCPPGYSLWVGAHGTATGTAGVRVTPTSGVSSVGAVLPVPLLSVTSSTRVNTRVDGNSFNGGLISLTGVGTLSLSGLMAQVLPTGQTPKTGNFISGQGHSGCAFTEEPVLTNYSVGIDRAGLSVNLVETEGWN